MTLDANDQEKYCIDGQFKHWKNEGQFPKCIIRGPGKLAKSENLFGIDEEERFLALEDFYSFRDEGGVGLQVGHGITHVFIGGHMAGDSSPYDPIFYFHHANIDRLFNRWQTRHGDFTSHGTHRGQGEYFIGFPIGEWTPSNAAKYEGRFKISQILDPRNMKLDPEDKVSYSVRYAESVNAQPKKSVVASRQKSGTSNGRDKRTAEEDEEKVVVVDEDNKLLGEEKDPKERREVIDLEAASCMAKYLLDNNKDKHDKIPKTCNRVEINKGRIEALKLMGDMPGGIFIGGSGKSGKKNLEEGIKALEGDLEKAKQDTLVSPKTDLERSICLSLEELLKTYREVKSEKNESDECIAKA